MTTDDMLTPSKFFEDHGIKIYQAYIEKDGDGWHVHCPYLQGVRTCRPELGAAMAAIREAIAAAYGGEPGDVIVLYSWV